MKKNEQLLGILCVVITILFPIRTLKAQEANEGLSLENGTLDGWELYLGRYFYDQTNEDDPYQYEWTRVTEDEARVGSRILLSGDVESQDKIVACSNFYKSPDRKSRYIQIGNSGDFYAEGRGKGYAYAEKIVYNFKVTENSSLFNYKYACVLHVPTNDNHTSLQMPSFEINITLTGTDGRKITLPCESFSGGANFQNESFSRNPSSCTAAVVAQDQERTDFIFKPWTTVSYDLKNYIGCNVKIEVFVHDCLVEQTAGRGGTTTVRAGSHKAYGYFWAETRPFKLTPRNCGNDDALITAPEGFVTYKWSCRETGESLRTLNGSPNVAVVPQGSIIDGAHYVCNLIGTNASCTDLTIDTVLHTIDLNPDFKYENACNLAVQFTDMTEIARDTIRTYEWDFGDGMTSVAKNPLHTYDAGGNYVVTLKILSGNGCTQQISRNITVQALPTIAIDGDQEVCQGDMIALSVLSSAMGKKYYWLNQDKDTVSREMSFNEVAKTSQSYKVFVVDQNNCQYSKDVYVSVSASPTIFIKGDSSVCFNTPAKLWAWGDADKYVWNAGVVGDTLNFTPQKSETFTVTGTYMNTGCKSSLSVTLSVNQLPTIHVEGPDSICAGESAILSAYGAKEYLWQNIYMGDSLNISPDVTTTYAVFGTDSNGCSNSAEYKLVVNALPKLNVHGNHDICEGEQLTLWLDGAQTYLWDDGSDKSNVTKTPTINTTSYTVKGFSKGCEASVNIPISVYPVPTVYIQGKSEICAGDSVSLMAQGADYYEWSTGEANKSNIKKLLTTSQTFYVTGKSSNNCVSTASFRVNVHSLPTFSISGPTAVCEGSTVQLSAVSETNGCTYQWDNGFLGAVFEGYVDDTTTFAIQATDTLNGCRSSNKFTVYTFPYPTLTIAGKTTICSGTSLNISASGASSFVWSDGSTSNTLVMLPSSSVNLWVEGTTNGCTSKIDVPITVLPAPYIWVDGKTTICYGDTIYLTARGADSTYIWNASVQGENYKSVPNFTSSVSVIGTNTQGCSSKLMVPITVNSKPMVGIAGHETVCENSSATLTVTGKNLVQFIWESGDMGQTITVPVPETKTFTVTAWDENGCSNVASHTIRAILPPPVSYTGDTAVCDGETVTLLAHGATNYVWMQNDAIFQQGDQLVYTPKNNALLKLVGTQNNCSAIVDVYVKVKNVPNLGIVGPTGVCKNENFILTATGADHYEWSTGDTTATISYPLSIASSYMVKGILNNGCEAKKTTRIEVYPDLNVTLEEVSKKGCPGSPTAVEIAPDGAMIYTWSSEPHNLTIYGTTSYNLEALITEPTEVYVIGTDINGCKGYDTLFVEPKTHSDMEYRITPAIVEKGHSTVGFDGIRPKNAAWMWRPGDGSDWLEGRNMKYTYDEFNVVTEDSFKVAIRAKDEDGCLYEQSTYVYVWKDFWAPTSFSPNGDGINDVFRFYGGEYVENFHFMIFNRVGQIIFEGNHIDDEWDGNYSNGKPCPQEIYGWVVTYSSNYKGIEKEGEQKGFITIIK